MGPSIPLPEAISIEKEKEPSISIPEVVSVDKSAKLAPVPVSEAMVTKPVIEPLAPALEVMPPGQEMNPPIPISETDGY